jgi:hypothetical protein
MKHKINFYLLTLLAAINIHNVMAMNYHLTLYVIIDTPQPTTRVISPSGEISAAIDGNIPGLNEINTQNTSYEYIEQSLTPQQKNTINRLRELRSLTVILCDVKPPQNIYDPIFHKCTISRRYSMSNMFLSSLAVGIGAGLFLYNLSKILFPSDTTDITAMIKNYWNKIETPEPVINVQPQIDHSSSLPTDSSSSMIITR